tara:strand:+ start:644 stop:1138 length:495 start_codon:yes stop_codon:yes gene_type:complete
MNNTYWRVATFYDIVELSNLSVEYFQKEVIDILTPSPATLSYNLHKALAEQIDNSSHMIYVCVADEKIVAYGWIQSTGKTIYSLENVAEVRMVHIQMDLPVKIRITIIKEMIELFENYCRILKIPVIITNTIRKDTRGFLALHEKLGYTIRGSFAFKQIQGEPK